MLLSGAVVALGAIIHLARSGGAAPDYATFKAEPPDFTSFSGIFKSAIAGHGRGIIAVGLLLLIATPIARVAFSLVTFLLRRDRVYVGVTLVSAVLLYGIFGGRP